MEARGYRDGRMRAGFERVGNKPMFASLHYLGIKLKRDYKGTLNRFLMSQLVADAIRPAYWRGCARACGSMGRNRP